jgi:phage regulator Rha-like protein
MGDIILATGKMTSLEIAKLTGKRHSHILRDIDKVLKELEID